MKTSLNIIIILLLSIFFSIKTNCQTVINGDLLLDENGVARAQVLISDIKKQDTSVQVFVDEIIILPKRIFKNEKEKIKYTKLMYNVKKVYPYAKIVNEIYSEIELELSKTNSKKDQKTYIKEKEKELTDKFEGVIREMTYTQGRILIKLVDRETGNTTYEVVKELKGSVNAFFWQSVALLFDSNLKLEYNPDDEDKMIEEIIAMIENGQI